MSELEVKKFVIMGDDTGLEIESLNNEPGIYVRRWNGKKMTDEEIIEHCIQRMKGIPKEKRNAKFRCVIAIALIEKDQKTKVELVEGILNGRILEEPDRLRIEGFPMESLFVIENLPNGDEILLGKFHQLSKDDKENLQVQTHRHRALAKALHRITQFLS